MAGFRWTWRPANGAAGSIARRARSANAAGLEAVASTAQGRARRRTGEYAASIRASSGGPVGDRMIGHVGSPLPQAGAVERGANVGPRRGPHMRGSPSIRPAAIETFGRAFAAKMREGGSR